MKTNLYLIFFLFSSICLGQVSIIPPNQLQQDFQLFKTALLETHPRLNRVYDTYSFEDKLNEYESLLSDSLTSLQFFQIVSSAMSNIGEAHSSVDISEEIKIQIEGAGRLLPLNIHFYNKRAFVLEDLSSEKDKLNGYEITKINGKSIDQIIKLIDSVSTIGSGVNQSRVYRKLSYDRNFALSYYLYADQSQSYLVEYKEETNSVEKATVVNGIPADFEISTILTPTERKPPFSFKIDKERDLAILRIKTFAHFIIGYKQKEYLKFYEECFRQIALSEITNLAIDVRGNRGGQERLGAHLLSYFLDEPFTIQNYIFTRELDFEVLDSLKIFHHTFDSKRFQAVDSGYVTVDRRHHVLAKVEPIKKNHFDGDVYIITDGNCFSACNIFVSLADYHDVGTIIGEETGGNYHDTDGYPGVIFKLPNSGLEIGYRLWHLRTAVENEVYGRGVIPDIAAQSTVEDILTETDAAMEKIYELIKQSKSR
ncbi:MAG: S41 family peptidase [Cyclobacteriaceae bacterium]